jgi:hypothetical protein
VPFGREDKGVDKNHIPLMEWMGLRERNAEKMALFSASKAMPAPALF